MPKCSFWVILKSKFFHFTFWWWEKICFLGRIIFNKKSLRSPDYIIALTFLGILTMVVLFYPWPQVYVNDFSTSNNSYRADQNYYRLAKYDGKLYPLEVARKIQEIESTMAFRGDDVILRHLKLLKELPWFEEAKENDDIDDVANYIKKSHFGMKKAKEGVIRSLALRHQMRLANRSPSACNTLCLLGGAGVGKSTLAKSIAEALHRPFVRINIASLTTRADLVGYPKSFRAAREGAILSAIHSAGFNNPVILLDEIDKAAGDMGTTGGGLVNPLLEILDQRQNNTFYDHFLEVNFDLSNVMFIATANSLDNISFPLFNRLETIFIPPYSFQEKKHIFKECSLPKILYDNGLQKGDISFEEEAIDHLIKIYAFEPGMRGIEHNIRNAIGDVILKCHGDQRQIRQTVIKKKDVKHYRSALEEIESQPRERADFTPEVGKVLAGAVNGFGVGVLDNIQGYVIPGTGKVEVKGLSYRGRNPEHSDFLYQQAEKTKLYLLNNAKKLGLSEKKIRNSDIIFEFPLNAAGASAGLAMTLAIYSALKNKPVKRGFFCLGTMGINGDAQIVGAIHQKVTGAIQEGVKDIYIARGCLDFLADIPEEEKKKVNIHPIDNIAEILDIALED